MKCDTCIVFNNEDQKNQIKVYEDDVCIAILTTKPASIGHMILCPKEHYVILEQLPDELVSHLFNVSNKLSQALFESLGVHGTNIFIQNGTPAGQDNPHFSIHIIGRQENDSVKLDWPLDKASEEELKTVMNMYKEETGDKVYGIAKSSNENNDNKKQMEIIDDDDPDEENYLVKYWERHPGSS